MKKNILHILTGSIAAYKAGDLISAFRDKDCEVTCVLTKSAKYFVTPVTLRALSDRPVYEKMFSRESENSVVHTELSDWADIILVAPASANFIARLAAGFADDLASCLILAATSPICIAPAMNDRMYEHPLTQQNIKLLKDIGYDFIDPICGRLACGRKGVGHIADTGEIVNHVLEKLK